MYFGRTPGATDFRGEGVSIGLFICLIFDLFNEMKFLSGVIDVAIETSDEAVEGLELATEPRGD